MKSHPYLEKKCIVNPHFPAVILSQRPFPHTNLRVVVMFKHMSQNIFKYNYYKTCDIA
jgi:hypothetical protein